MTAVISPSGFSSSGSSRTSKSVARAGWSIGIASDGTAPGHRDADWYLGGALASASLFIAGPVPETLASAGPDLRRSIFRLDTGESCMRWCGHPAAVTADLVHTALRLAAHWTVGPDAPPWLLASSSLSPNHWFSTPVG